MLAAHCVGFPPPAPIPTQFFIADQVVDAKRKGAHINRATMWIWDFIAWLSFAR